MQDLGRISISNTVTVYLARAYYISMWGTIYFFFDLMINKILNWGYIKNKILVILKTTTWKEMGSLKLSLFRV